ncbi:MAG TPA: FixG Ig-like domain-containing protein, partial [Methylotenera sp.]|nr:FixG Ig-like domain-containing protein [Methylotenera sp.]
ASVTGLNKTFVVAPGKVIPVTALVRMPPNAQSDQKLHYIEFTATAVNGDEVNETYNSVFITP